MSQIQHALTDSGAAAGKTKEAETMKAMVASAHDESALHEIRVQGHLDDRWADWTAGLTFTRESDGTTTLTGPLAEQAALHGVLNRLRDLNMPIISFGASAPRAGGAR